MTNWYKLIISQFYEDVLRDGSEDPETFEAEKYFSIGQNEESREESVWWVWYGGKLYSKKEAKSHNILFPFMRDDRVHNKVFKGVFDPVQNMISVAFPVDFTGVKEKKTEFDIPDDLLRNLRKKFGLAKIVCF